MRPSTQISFVTMQLHKSGINLQELPENGNWKWHRVTGGEISAALCQIHLIWGHFCLTFSKENKSVTLCYFVQMEIIGCSGRVLKSFTLSAQKRLTFTFLIWSFTSWGAEIPSDALVISDNVNFIVISRASFFLCSSGTCCCCTTVRAGLVQYWCDRSVLGLFVPKDLLIGVWRLLAVLQISYCYLLSPN